MVAESDQSIRLPVPVPDGRLFRYAATPDVLALLVNSPETRFSVRDIRRATGHSPSTVTDSVDLLADCDLVRITREGNRKLVRINTDRLESPADPVARIPQREFHEPVRALVERLRERLDGLAGVVVFGSVARGEADRASDVDCFVLVEGERAGAQATAHELASELGERRFNEAVAQRAGGAGTAGRGRPDGHRYEFEVLVESAASAERVGERLEEILAEGIPVLETERLQELKREVLTNG
jgi:predicted nucleotidyltransferase